MFGDQLDPRYIDMVTVHMRPTFREVLDVDMIS